MIRPICYYAGIILCGLTLSWADDGGRDTLIFSHRLHMQDVGATCADCHTNGDSTKPFKIIPAAAAACKKCHDSTGISFECKTCPPNDTAAKILPSVILNARFSHEKHLVRSADCAACHGAIAFSDKPGRTFIPSMKTCQACHNGLKAPSACAACHENLRSIMPVSHDNGWLARGGHGEQSRYPSADCRSCHNPKWCDACHQGNAMMRIHPAGYEFEHGFDVKSRALDCGVCHETPRSCNRCHEGKR